MKTHSLARALRQLADALEAGPNIEMSKKLRLGQLELPDSDSVAVNLETLMALSRISKTEWLKLIRDYGFEIDVRPRDASRDILGRLLAYLDSHPEAIATLRRRAHSEERGPSALTQALDVLLKDR